MRQRKPGETRDFREDIDEMGDDEQAYEVDLTEEYTADPPAEHVIREPDQDRDGLSVSEYDEQAFREGDEHRPAPDTAAESDAVNPTNRP